MLALYHIADEEISHTVAYFHPQTSRVYSMKTHHEQRYSLHPNFAAASASLRALWHNSVCILSSRNAEENACALPIIQNSVLPEMSCTLARSTHHRLVRVKSAYACTSRV